MPVYKHEWLREITQSFGMNVQEFAACIGYTKQRLYQAATAGDKLHWGHLQLAAEKLATANEQLREKAMQKAQEDYDARARMVQDMLKRLGG